MSISHLSIGFGHVREIQTVISHVFLMHVKSQIQIGDCAIRTVQNVQEQHAHNAEVDILQIRQVYVQNVAKQIV